MKNTSNRSSFILFLFFISGFSSLTYQIAWHRSLMTFIGSNIETVTVIVSLFMLGLGLGALAGGPVSNKFKKNLVPTFGLIEALIGLFGIFSLWLIKTVGMLLLPLSLPKVTLGLFLLLLLPTFLMGTTLPILIQVVHKTKQPVWKSVRSPYFVNTLGAAFAALCVVEFLFPSLGLRGTVLIAAFANFLIAASIFIINKKTKEERI